MDIIKIVEYVSWGFVGICSLFLLLSIIDLIQKSIKKIGVLWSLGYSILDISSLFLIVESILLGIAFLFSLVICYLGIWLANSLLLTNALYINNLFNFGIVQIGYILLVIDSIIFLKHPNGTYSCDFIVNENDSTDLDD